MACFLTHFWDMLKNWQIFNTRLKNKKAKNFKWIFGVVKQKAIETSRFGLLIKPFANSAKSHQNLSPIRKNNESTKPNRQSLGLCKYIAR